jgi:hypothetical protein
MKKLLLLLSVVLTFNIAPGARAQIPTLINYQGRVAVDAVNFEGTGLFKFALVNEDGSTTFWSNDGTSAAGSEPTDSVSLTVAKGLYSVLLGDVSLANMTAIPASVFTNPDVRLRVWFDDGVNGSQLLTPDQRLAPSAYLADGAVNSAALADEAVVATKIAPGTIDGTRLAPASLDFSLLQVPSAPIAGQVLGFDGNTFSWMAPGGGGGEGNYWAQNGASIYYNGGNVGIGTASPDYKFMIADGAAQLAYSGAYIRSGYLGGDGGELDIQGGWSNNNGGRLRLGGGARGDADRNVVQFFQNNLERMRINDGGAVGIGISTPAAKLHLYDPFSVTHLIETGGGTNAWSQVSFKNANGQWDVGTSRAFFNDRFYIARHGLPMSFYIDSGGFFGGFTTADFYLGHASRRGSPGRALVDFGSSLVVNFGNDWGTTTIGGAVTEVTTLRILGGADLAEPFAMSEEKVEPGSVVVIDENAPGRLRMSRCAYDCKVAGVVSGGHGIRAGISMIQEGMLEAGKNVALSGRVYVKADTSGGAIHPGDMLTTSENPGRAMRASDRERASGAVLGKSMTSLEEGEGEVLVLVTLQ